MKLTKEEKAWFIEEWKKSGKSKWAFAKELGICTQTFTNWTKEAEPGVPFVEVKANSERTRSLIETETRSTNEMVIEKGMIKVHLPKGVTQSDLALVIQVLG